MRACVALLLLSVAVYNADAAKKEPTMSERVEQLTGLALARPIIRFNSDKFRQFVRASPRNYSMVVMFTALSPQRECGICGLASEEFAVLGNSWRYSNAFSNKMFLAQVDFDEASDIFSQMKLNTAPVFMHFPAKGKPKKADTLDLERVGFQGEAIAKWIQERADVQIRVSRPASYSGLIGLSILLAFVVGMLYFRKNNLEFLANSTTWGFIALTFVFVMISGQMWNHIRGPPLMQKTRDGGVAYIHGSSQGQFVAETYIVGAMYACVSLGMVMVTWAASSPKEDGTKRRVAAMLGVALMLVFFSLLLSVFRNKAGGYPYSLFFK